MNAYVLVGGRSRRMGRSKTGLFLNRVIAAARPAFDEVIAVARAGAAPCDEVRTIFEVPREEHAAMHGVHAALAHAGARCVLLAVDYPLITTELLRWLAGRTAESDAAMVVTEWQRQWQPLCAGYDAPRVLPLVEKRIVEGRLDLRGLVAEAAAELIRESELRAIFPGEPLMNINTPEELARMEKLDE